MYWRTVGFFYFLLFLVSTEPKFSFTHSTASLGKKKRDVVYNYESQYGYISTKMSILFFMYLCFN